MQYGERELKPMAIDLPRPSKELKILESLNGVYYEESARYADPNAVATSCMIEITSAQHFHKIMETASGANGHTGYVDAQGRQRLPHKLMLIQVYANWCVACKGLTPHILRMCAARPDVLCCKLNKGQQEDLAAELGVRALPTIIFYKAGKRVDHLTTADRDDILEAIEDNT